MIQEVATPARQSSSSIPIAQAFTPTTQAMVLVGHTTAEIALHPTAQVVPVASTFQQLTAPAPRANLAAPDYHYSTPSRNQSRYDIGHNDGPNQEDGNPRNYYGNRVPRFAKGKGKGKGKSYNAKSTWGAMPKDWDADQVIIPEYGETHGMSFYTVSNLTTEGQSTYTVKIPTVFVRSPATGHPIHHMDNQQIRTRTNPSDLNQDGNSIDNIVSHYHTALRAISEVRQSVTHFQMMEEGGRVVDLRGTPIPNGYASTPLSFGRKPENAPG